MLNVTISILTNIAYWISFEKVVRYKNGHERWQIAIQLLVTTGHYFAITHNMSSHYAELNLICFAIIFQIFAANLSWVRLFAQ